MIEGDQAADDRLLPDRQPNTVAVLQSEAGFLVGKSEFLRLGPDRGNLRRGSTGPHQLNCRIEIFAAALVGVHHGVRSKADGETAVVAGAVAHVRSEEHTSEL